MQTKEQCLEKVKEMAAQVRDHLIMRTEQLFKSGAINPPDFEDDYQLPKILLTAALEWEADQWRPFDKKMRAKVKNLSYF
jgi:hypothetical protein